MWPYVRRVPSTSSGNYSVARLIPTVTPLLHRTDRCPNNRRKATDFLARAGRPVRRRLSWVSRWLGTTSPPSQSTPRIILHFLAVALIIAQGSCATRRHSALEAQSPEVVFAKATMILRTSKSAHFREVQTRGTEMVTIDSYATRDEARSVATSGRTRVETIWAKGRYYERSPRTHNVWREFSTASQVAAARHSTLTGMADCLATEHGHLRILRTTALSRRSVIVLGDDGAAPGASPGKWYVSVDPPRLVGYEHTGPDAPGGLPGCGHTAAGVVIRVTVDRYDKHVSIVPPVGVD